MVPDPHCASCNSDFVEKMEDPSDDPREFAPAPHPGDDAPDMVGLLNYMFGGPMPGRGDGSGLRLELRSNNGPARTIVLGGQNTLPQGRREGHGGHMHPFLEALAQPRGPRGDDEVPNGAARDARVPLLGNYLMALLAGHPMVMGGMGGGNGRWGDYALDQDELDRIITQLMEAGNVNRPVPAPADLVSHLPRRTVSAKGFFDASPDARAKECAVCKDPLIPDPTAEGASTPDGDTTLVTLPCAHEFHEDCIIPWLENSGTCPVCRHQLVAQPQQHGPGEGGPAPPGPAFGMFMPPGPSSGGAGLGRTGPSPASSASASASGPGRNTSPTGASHRSSAPTSRPRSGDGQRRSPPPSTRYPLFASRAAREAAREAAVERDRDRRTHSPRRSDSRPPSPSPPGAWHDVD